MQPCILNFTCVNAFLLKHLGKSNNTQTMSYAKTEEYGYFLVMNL